MEEELRQVPIIALPLPKGLVESGLLEEIEGGFLLKLGVVVVFTDSIEEEATNKLLVETARVLNDRFNQDPIHPLSK